MLKRLKKGQRIKLKVRLMSGWKGYGTVIVDDGECVCFVKEGRDPEDYLERCVCNRDELSVCRA